MIPISRNHARIVRVGETCYVEDMQSRSGTRLNNQMIRERTALALDNRDRIQICDFGAVYFDEPFAGVPATEVPAAHPDGTSGLRMGLPPLMTEQEWHGSIDPVTLLDRMLGHLRTEAALEKLGLDPASVDLSHLAVFPFGSGPTAAYQRKLRLFVCACARRLWHHLGCSADEESVALAERYADGEVTDQEWEQMRQSMGWHDMPPLRAGQHARQPLSDVELYATREAARAVVTALGFSHQQRSDHERLELMALLRDIFRPFQKVSIDPTWLAWEGGLVGRIARAAYEERCLPEGRLEGARLAVLADALEDAGCTNPDLLEHLRGPGLHVRGCWVVDLLRGNG